MVVRVAAGFRAPAAERSAPPPAVLWRLGRRSYAPGTSEHDEDKAERLTSSPGAAVAPPIVGAVLRRSGAPLPDGIRRDMERRLGHDFADVRVHTDARAGESARAVGADAYTVGRAIVFGDGRFDPGSHNGRKLIAHELAHAAEHSRGGHFPSGTLLVSTPHDDGERRAERASRAALDGGPVVTAQPPSGSAPWRLQRQPAPVVVLTGATINHRRGTVPPVTGLSLTAGKTPANATGVRFSLVGDTATLAAGTTINATTGAITVAATQTGGRAFAVASQTITAPDGSSTTSTESSPSLNFVATPDGIASTSASLHGAARRYGGNFTHSFSPPSGSSASALERAHVNEQFAGASGTTLTITGTLGTIDVDVNDPNNTSHGWDLDAAGTMVAADEVTWRHSGIDARPFVVNASNPSPANTLPQELTATQTFRNLIFPTLTWGTAAAATTTHRRAIEDRSDRLTAVTSANVQEVEEDYAGPTVFRRCRADPDTVEVSAPAPRRGRAPAPNTTTVQVDAEGQAARPRFSIQGNALGCTINATTGVLRVGTTPGTVRVRGGGTTNFDETTVTITPTPTPTPTPNPTPNPTPTP